MLCYVIKRWIEFLAFKLASASASARRSAGASLPPSFRLTQSFRRAQSFLPTQSYVMDHDYRRAPDLRQVIAAAVASDPVKYNEAFLGKSNDEYCTWILNPEKWGGAIELSILSEYYDREIAAYDIQTNRCDLYGQSKGYRERVMLIYDGLHYDALAMSPFANAPDEFDQTIFTVNFNRTIGSVEDLVLNLVKDAYRVAAFQEEEIH